MTEDNKTWDERVLEAADKMSLETQENLLEVASSGSLRALGEYVAAEVLWTMDQMKEPGILHEVFKKEE